ncbi:Myosin-binding protein 2 [Carex littledalei]|uniref:Myosin-binding protein 2 n=1 Tax=Carex littledalei TaxID=544730 RepID=A0A833QLZ7_9POAL|nr:Myosin-binding protein 2 [Carex littledalei]
MLAFVDLSIAFLLLWFAALTFSSQTIIGPLNALLIRLEAFLLHHSTRKISTVHRTICRLFQFEGQLLELGISRRHDLTEAESFHGPTMSRRESTLSTYSVSGDVSSSLLNDGETTDKTEVNLEDENPSISTRNLKRALKEEKTAHAKLRRELEAERRAAETAAFETMAKIAFLQEEKANIEREARQYRIEQGGKSKYKDDQIENLEEKLIDRDRQIYIMEKENEAYRQILKERGLNSSVDTVVELEGENDGSLTELQEKGMVATQRFPSHDNNNFKLDSNYNNDVHIISNGRSDKA